MKTIIMLVGGVLAVSHASAQTIVQSATIAPYTASGSRVVTFEQFNSLGGLRQLTGVEVAFEFDKTAGSYAVDNDSNEAGNITFYHEIRARLTSVDVPLGSSGAFLAAISEYTAAVGADNGDPQNQFDTDAAGNDYILFAADSILGTGNIANLAAHLWGAYIGTETFDITFQALQAFSADGVGGLQSQTISSIVSPTVSVIYHYLPVTPVPEPEVAMLGALGAIPLLRRGRRRIG